MRQGEADAVTQGPHRHAILQAEYNRALAFVAEYVGIEFPELADEAALTVEVDRIPLACRSLP
jgi:hypothetical protein